MFLKNLISYLFLYVVGTHIDSEVEQVKENKDDITTLYVRSVSGVQITFYCTKNNYIIKNKKPYIPDFKYYVYKLHGECGDNCPEKLSLVLENVAYFPSLRPLFTTEHKRRKFLIETYISLLNFHLKNEQTNSVDNT